MVPSHHGIFMPNRRPRAPRMNRIQGLNQALGARATKTEVATLQSQIDALKADVALLKAR